MYGSTLLDRFSQALQYFPRLCEIVDADNVCRRIEQAICDCTEVRLLIQTGHKPPFSPVTQRSKIGRASCRERVCYAV